MLIEKITSQELQNLTVNYSFADSRFGNIIVASTGKGVCYLGFTEEKDVLPKDLKRRFPKVKFVQKEDECQKNAISAVAENSPKEVKLHLKCTDFQLKVFEELLKTRVGELTAYGEIARKINRPKASRAVGTAVGSNPVALLIPCHRVVLASGNLGNYRWGKERKTAMINFERQ
ncbi:MAG: methylated-DNA--[protein]-cysteine S-methyltransferase [Prevotellaceae bacterium]|jgi:AraC family transcriptional regulator of adaptative response/methylated-DNA-[protein]-cysteine methyltransferase|nr:methylated-DNA--[protein]-cysteine S-methyltransferase [Prevotellaceae bacterium]